MGAVLVHVYEHIIAHSTAANVVRFLAPIVYFAVDDTPRIAFASADQVTHPLPPEILGVSERWDERSIVFAIGRALGRVVIYRGVDSKLAKLIRDCVHDEPRRRIKSLALLSREFHKAGAREVSSNGQNANSRYSALVEQGRGYISLELYQEAVDCFRDATSLLPLSELANQLRLAAQIEVKHHAVDWSTFKPTQLTDRPAPIPYQRPNDLHRPPRVVPPQAWDWEEAESRGAAFERARDFTQAELLYWKATTKTKSDELSRFTAIARCCFHRQNFDDTQRYADLALEVDPTCAAAFELKCNALLHSTKLGDARFRAALDIATTWCAAHPLDSDAHYARGKALLRLEHHADARDAFDAALKADPKLVEAMLLRRQAELAMNNTRAHVGAPTPMQLDVPDDLLELREAVIGGKLDDALALLAKPELAEHAAAQLYRGQILFFLERYVEALSVLEHLTSGEARYARARVLTALDRYEEALAELDVIRDAHPEITDAAATRAYVLDALGRPREAEAAELAYLDSAKS
ncbi:MAG TPA: tetratricopeptide repeat protein [Kofleriaceae bacterium]